MGVNIYFSLKHAQAVSRSIETATYAMYENSPDDSDYRNILYRVAKDLRYVKDQLDSYIETEDLERRKAEELK